MLELKDPAIKLFGKTIQLQPNDVGATAATTTMSTATHQDQNFSATATLQEEKLQKSSKGELTESRQEETSSWINEDPKTPNDDKESPSLNTPQKDDPDEMSISEEKTLKKPDKIIPCPRCNSMETKFCYYNNYNVNQPRHFCKKCQRYWTAGGTMRNVPVGSGRRKNKSSPASNYRHIMVSEALQVARVENAIHHPALKSNGKVLSFGSSNAPLCESMASALKLAEKSQNRFHKQEQEVPISAGRRDNGDDHSSGSCSIVMNLTENGGTDTPLTPCFPGPPWPSPWNSAQWNSQMPPHPFVPFYPVPHYWGCTVPPNPWSMPWLSQPPASPDQSVLTSSSNSPTLGKHSRDVNFLKRPNPTNAELLEEKYPDRNVLIPKTLRISDPSEAAKSSIWSTLGIKNDNTDSVSGGSLFKAFQPKGNTKAFVAETSVMLQANPAAMSRSLNFHESS